MTNSGIVIPNEINKILDERAAFWENFDQAQTHLKEMENLSSQVASSIPSQLPSKLTNEKTPASEFTAARQNFQAELARIKKNKETINTYQVEIKRIEKQQFTTVIIFVFIAILIFAIVVSTI